MASQAAARIRSVSAWTPSGVCSRRAGARDFFSLRSVMLLARADFASIDQIKKQDRQQNRAEQTGVNFLHLEFERRVREPHADPAHLRHVFQAEDGFQNIRERQTKAAE